MDNITLRPAQPENRAALETLLTSFKLPIEDLPEDLSGFMLAFDGTALVGSAGMEPLGPYGLLRSVAVDDTYRSFGIGQQLYSGAMEFARARRLREVWLITTTADRYFERLGFERIKGGRVPAEIAATAQFTGLCAATPF